MKSKKYFKHREPLTNEELENLRGGDFAKIALTEEEWVRMGKITKRREKEYQVRVAQLLAEQQPLLEELNSSGLDIQIVGQLQNIPNVYDAALPILAKHLQMDYSDATLETIARAMAVPASKQYWGSLVDKFKSAKTGKGICTPGDLELRRFGAKDGLAAALSAACNEKTLPELIALAKDKSHGDSRILLLSTLKRRRKKNILVKEALVELANDPDLKIEIASWKKI